MQASILPHLDNSPKDFLSSEIVMPRDISESMRQEMYVLYKTYYSHANYATFVKDLNAKTHTVVLRNPTGNLKGFSTLVFYSLQFEGKEVNIVYSGDTIIDAAYWGRNRFSFDWLRLAGKVKQKAPNTPLYWFLLVKGHRTYRYLDTYTHVYYPSYKVQTPVSIRRLMDTLASDKFGLDYKPDRGVISFTNSKGQLYEPWTTIPEKDHKRPSVRFFLDKNPGYTHGEELVCLCDLSLDNLKPLPRRAFAMGLES